jgi:Flp pilus assembly protein TadD
VLDDSGRPDDAMREYETAIRLRPTPEAYNNVAVILLRQGRPAEAVAALRRGIALRADVAQLHENLSTALQQLNDREGATTEFREALRLDPSRAASRGALTAPGTAPP